MTDSIKIVNRMICKVVESKVIAVDPDLANPDFRRNMPDNEKKLLVNRMIQEALRLGAIPTKPL